MGTEMSDHTLTIFDDGGGGIAYSVMCHAQMSASGQPPICWTFIDEDDGKLYVADHCGAVEWIQESGEIEIAGEITLPVKFTYDSNGAPTVVVEDMAQKVAEGWVIARKCDLTDARRGR